eukprot:TRINITY_DN53410_c0_g1_i1.p1 TRINITY_DN53410_c0_g1~~TRINITY_DN53410_c0_g1_i1.p1  ORF type:complete len:105 (+),score=10.50 TRINITY_DN53410_c0_g1_i1:18-332(+)
MPKYELSGVLFRVWAELNRNQISPEGQFARSICWGDVFWVTIVHLLILYWSWQRQGTCGRRGSVSSSCAENARQMKIVLLLMALRSSAALALFIDPGKVVEQST